MAPQHQEKPGVEAKLKPRPNYQAPAYQGAGKLREKVALITGEVLTLLGGETTAA